MSQSVQEFMTFNSSLIKKMFQDLGEIRPFIVLLGENDEGFQVNPLIIPTKFFESEIGKTFVKTVILKKEIEDMKSEGYELRCVSFSSECWMKKVVINESGVNVKKENEVVIVSYEMKDESVIQVYDIKRNMNVTSEGLVEEPTLELNESLSDNKNKNIGSIIGMMSKLFTE